MERRGRRERGGGGGGRGEGKRNREIREEMGKKAEGGGGGGGVKEGERGKGGIKGEMTNVHTHGPTIVVLTEGMKLARN